MTDNAYTEILALRRRLARIEEMATAAQPPPADNPATFGDALAVLRATGSATGSAVDALRAAVTGSRAAPDGAPDPDQLKAATQRVVGGMAGSSTFEGALATMRANATRRDTIENIQAGASGHVDVLEPRTASAIDRLRAALNEEH